jgi:hypothetical protein
VLDLLSINVTIIPRNGFTYFVTKEIVLVVEKYCPTYFTEQEVWVVASVEPFCCGY